MVTSTKHNYLYHPVNATAYLISMYHDPKEQGCLRTNIKQNSKITSDTKFNIFQYPAKLTTKPFDLVVVATSYELTWSCERVIKMNVDDIVYVICLLACIGAGSYVRKIPCKVQKRYISTALGLLMVFIVSGFSSFHCLVSSLLGAAAVIYVHPR